MQRPGTVPPAACPVQLCLAFDLSTSREAVVRAVLRQRLSERANSFEAIAARLGVGYRQVRAICTRAAEQL